MAKGQNLFFMQQYIERQLYAFVTQPDFTYLVRPLRVKIHIYMLKRTKILFVSIFVIIKHFLIRHLIVHHVFYTAAHPGLLLEQCSGFMSPPV